MPTAIIQARMSSTRLPGKVMMQIRNKPLLYHVINQVRQCKKLSNIIIATTTLQEDELIINYVKSLGLDFYRGSEEDVLDRYYQCAKQFKVDVVVRITSDCPLIDPTLVDRCITEFENIHSDYLSNVNKIEGVNWVYDPCGFPMGFAVEVFTFNALEKAWKNAKKPSEREHVTQYILNNPSLFTINSIENSENLSNIRLTVDHIIDFDLVKIIIEHFPVDEIFTIQRVVSFLNQNPNLKQMNSNIPFNEGYLKSLKDDEIAEKRKK